MSSFFRRKIGALFILLPLVQVSAYGPGDLDNDGQITVLDASRAVELVLETDSATAYEEFAADPNFDESNNILDIVSIVEAALGLIEYPQYPERILFIGNSYTYYNGGQADLLAQLVSATHPGLELTAEQRTQGGATLEMHWQNSQTLSQITLGNWDYVVLQEQSLRPIQNPELMFQYADSLNAVILDSGAETTLFMTWARAYDPAMIQELDSTYTALGAVLRASVAPVGRAWATIVENHPEINLYAADESHPNAHGSYLTACVFYALFYQRSPEGILWANSDTISEDQRILLQQVAWQTVQLYQQP